MVASPISPFRRMVAYPISLIRRMVSPALPWREGVRGREVMLLVICVICQICIISVKKKNLYKSAMAKPIETK